MLGDSKIAVAITTTIALGMMAFHLWVVFDGAPELFHFRGTHLLFALVLTFLWYPLFKDATGGKMIATRAVDSFCIAGSIAVIGYLFVEHDYVLTRFAYVDDLRPLDAIFGVLIILLVLDSTPVSSGSPSR